MRERGGGEPSAAPARQQSEQPLSSGLHKSILLRLTSSFSRAETETSGGLEVVLDVCLRVISAAPAVLPAVQAIRDRLGCCKLTEPNTGSMTSCSRPAPSKGRSANGDP